MSDPVIVEPDFTKSGIEASRTYKNRSSDNGAEYPIEISDHLLQVKYTFKRDSGGLLQLYGISYQCEKCKKSKSLSDCGNLRYLEKDAKRKVRKYLIGHFVETDCL